MIPRLVALPLGISNVTAEKDLTRGKEKCTQSVPTEWSEELLNPSLLRMTNNHHSPIPPLLPKKRPDFVEDAGGGGF